MSILHVYFEEDENFCSSTVLMERERGANTISGKRIVFIAESFVQNSACVFVFYVER